MCSFVNAALLAVIFGIGLSDQYVNTTSSAGAGQSRVGYCPKHYNTIMFSEHRVKISENRLKGAVLISLDLMVQGTRNCYITPPYLEGYFKLQYLTIKGVIQLVVNKTIPYNISSNNEITIMVRAKGNKRQQGNRHIIHVLIDDLQMALVTVPTQEKILYKKSTNYSRVFQSGVTDVIKASSAKLVYRFEILQPNNLKASLNITPSTAIVYVQNDYLLSGYQGKPTDILFRIFVEDTLLQKQWKFEDTVKLKGEKRKDHCASKSCSNAEHHTEELCSGRCGLGTNESGCVWTVTENYISCSSDPKTCPDYTCDELESMHFGICPQDCVDSNLVGDAIFVDSSKRPASGKGIGGMPTYENSVCICHSSVRHCVCRRPTPQELLANNEDSGSEVQSKMFNESDSTTAFNPGMDQMPYKPNVLTSKSDGSNDRAMNTQVCGGMCQVFIVTGCLLVCVALAILLWRSGCIRCVHRGFHKLPFGVHVEMQMTAINANYAQNEIFYRIQGIPPTVQQYKLDCDPKWEFPRSNLLFQDILGEGEFGRVVKAQALNIRGHTGYKTVAVKMLKPCATDVDMRDLVTELNLLKQVNNPNVIRLLGSCTQKGPLLVIVEYCENGSLRKFLREHRKRPIYTDHTPTPNSERSLPLDDATSHSNITELGPRDLLSFAWQICKGMHYLSTLKLVHRDLAARNVLVADGLVIKISDFGLMRDIYEADSYKRTSKGRIPVKWIAIESLYDNVYTAKSDVWSFAILLWEIVTMGATPYPGVTSERLYNILKTGYRMMKPDGCSDELYNIMTRCWSEKPMDRPSFQELCEIFENMLKRNIEYLDLTELQHLSHNEDEDEEEEMQASQMVKMRLLRPNQQSSSTQSSTSREPRIEKINEFQVKRQATGDEESYQAC